MPPPPPPCLLLRTLDRGDGLLGLKPCGPVRPPARTPLFGARGPQVTVAWLRWPPQHDGRQPATARLAAPLAHVAPLAPLAPFASSAPLAPLAPLARVVPLAPLAPLPRSAHPPDDGDATTRLRQIGLLPLPAAALQWRGEPLPELAGQTLYSLVREADFSALWADALPALQAEGWTIDIQPGFAHAAQPVAAWHIDLQALTQPRGMGSWLLSLGVDVQTRDGSQRLDLVPLMARLIGHDRRWTDADALAAIPDDALIRLHAPGGRLIDAEAAPLKAIARAMLDVLTRPARRGGPGVVLSSWEAQRLALLRAGLKDAMASHPSARRDWLLNLGAEDGAENGASDRSTAAEDGAADRASDRSTAAAGVAIDDADVASHAASHAADHPGNLAANPADRLSARRWLDAQGPANPPPPVAPPAGLGITLRPYQCDGLAWLQHLRRHRLAGILADDMGLGKTAQALAHLLVEKQAGRLDIPALVVAPASLIFNWQAEARRVAPALALLTLQGPRRSADMARIAGHDIVLTSYPLLWRDAMALQAQAWHLVVLDESQMVKNAGSRTATSARRLNARHRLSLTGTPMENHLGELWAQFHFLLPGYLGDARSFVRDWRTPIEKNGETLRAQLLARRVAPFILRRRKAEVATELPALTEQVHRVALAGPQRALYESVRLASDERVRKVLDRHKLGGAMVSILDALLKLRQVCNDPRLLLDAAPAAPELPPSAKVAWLRETLPTLVAEGRRILVFSQFTRMLALLAPELNALAIPFLTLTGDTPTADRGERVAQFQRGETPVFLVSLKAGGVGLNLTAADTVIHIDPWWNPAVEQQASARAHRIGQTRPVTVYRLVVAGSIEERLLALQARKAALAEAVLGDGFRLRSQAATAPFVLEDLQGLLAPLD